MKSMLTAAAITAALVAASLGLAGAASANPGPVTDSGATSRG
jgi:hypothetical protein